MNQRYAEGQKRLPEGILRIHRQNLRDKRVWSENHHVVPSRTNADLPKTRRDYFDELPTVIKRHGEFQNSLVLQPELNEDDKERAHRLKRRFHLFPEFMHRMRGGARLVPWWPTSSRSVTPLDELKESFMSAATPTPTSPAPEDEAELLEEETPAATRSEPIQFTDLFVALEPYRKGRASSKQKNLDPGRKKTYMKGRHSRTGVEDDIDPLTLPPLEHLSYWCGQKRLTLTSLWRKLDADMSFTLSKKEFQGAIRKLRYPGDVEKLWSAIDADGTGIVTFLEYAQADALDLARFKSWCVNKFGSMRKAFEKLDTDRSGAISYHEFISACKTEGIPARLTESLRTLFLLLDDPDSSAGGRGAISVDEFCTLDNWRIPRFLLERPDWAAQEPFRKALLRRSDFNPLMAWRKFLDKDSSMRVTYEEFTAVCAKLARDGFKEAQPEKSSSTALYLTFDDDTSGWFTLDDWDEPAYDLLARFAVLVKKDFGNYKAYCKAYERKPSKSPDGSGKKAEGGIGIGAFARSVKALELDEDETEMLYYGLNLGKATRLQTTQLAFLDQWDPVKEIEENLQWHKTMGSRVTIAESNCLKKHMLISKLQTLAGVLPPPAEGSGELVASGETSPTADAEEK
eukprot:TRINITY_DN83541_c0_g1_i1.p1 TRINITY_DN83541_c0_g1~~TRINITY_DN83541_c0_g1_i1.p1  ORF type:complete len:628 (-),score=168.49 TRINITY_DN83541_c0_g1_i1:208-2091(-)